MLLGFLRFIPIVPRSPLSRGQGLKMPDLEAWLSGGKNRKVTEKLGPRGNGDNPRGISKRSSLKMVVIRLSRCGARHRPKYRVAVADSRRSATGRFIEIIGQYDSTEKAKKEGFKIDVEKYKKWVAQGAQPSQTLRSLVKKVYSI